ncbi:MAG: hypothetical protein RL156_422 [Bacteroidota bacterium]
MWFPIKYWCAYGHLLLTVAVLACSLTLSSSCYAQGFDWEYSERMPKYSSAWYGGASALYANDGHTSNIDILEKAGAEYPEIICAALTSGSGNDLRISLAGEYWFAGGMSLSLRAGYSTRQALFTAQSPDALLFDGSILRTKYELSTNVHALCVEPAVKVCIPSTHVWGSVGLSAEFITGSKTSLIERVLTPSGFVFTGTTSAERLLADRDRVGIRGFVVNPFVSAGVDLDVATDMYVSPSLSLGLPLMSYAEWASWKTISVGCRVSMLFAL